MAYSPINWTQIVPATDHPFDAINQLAQNGLGLEVQSVIQHGMLSASLRLVEPSGTHPLPPVDPTHPDVMNYTGQDTPFFRSATLTWSGDKVVSEYHRVYDESAVLEEVDNSTDPGALLTYTYSAVSGAESVPIAGTWS